MSNWTVYIYKLDRRTKTGQRIFSTTVWKDRDEASMQREVEELYAHHYPRTQFHIQFAQVA